MIAHFPPTVSPAELSDELRRQGCVIVDDLGDADHLDQLLSEARPYIDTSAQGRDEYDGRFTRRTGALIARCPAVRPLVMEPLVTATVENFLSHVTTVQLHLTQLITIAPGETAQKLHRDEMAFDFYPFPPAYHVQCNTMWALTDFTVENGATRIRPGTSALADEDGEAVAVVQAEMSRGSCLLYDGKVFHGGGANRSDADRIGVNLTYAVGWVRQEENQYLACPAEIARTLDDDLLRMMGYRQGAFALGYVGDQTDPLAALRGSGDKVKVIADIATGTPATRFVEELTTNQDDAAV